MTALGTFASLLTAVTAATAPSNVPGELGRAVKPTFEAVRLEIDPRQKDYQGSARIELEVVHETAEIRFHAEEMTLSALELRGPKGAIAVERTAGGGCGSRSRGWSRGRSRSRRSRGTAGCGDGEQNCDDGPNLRAHSSGRVQRLRLIGRAFSIRRHKAGFAGGRSVNAGFVVPGFDTVNLSAIDS